ncbi:hypothetical protein PsorP6_001602 [Peronosclerospora sorghi]|uniref:Uncharacterized protein n=1 Tax=Peronosclerospora sorghi TaxID=230839 RepID=A0ACC0WSI1_9STRA|nr:hypothetical protein PsorP6_001602 [Peronosclerospora sorghi]
MPPDTASCISLGQEPTRGTRALDRQVQPVRERGHKTRKVSVGGMYFPSSRKHKEEDEETARDWNVRDTTPSTAKKTMDKPENGRGVQQTAQESAAQAASMTQLFQIERLMEELHQRKEKEEKSIQSTSFSPKKASSRAQATTIGARGEKWREMHFPLNKAHDGNSTLSLSFGNQRVDPAWKGLSADRTRHLCVSMMIDWPKKLSARNKSGNGVKVTHARSRNGIDHFFLEEHRVQHERVRYGCFKPLASKFSPTGSQPRDNQSRASAAKVPLQLFPAV